MGGMNMFSKITMIFGLFLLPSMLKNLKLDDKAIFLHNILENDDIYYNETKKQ